MDRADDSRDEMPGSAFESGADDSLDRELDEALGSLNMESLMDLDDPGATPAVEGVRRGTVISIHGDDIFVDMGGKSQGLLAADQFGNEPLPEVGDVVEVTVEGYDRADGILILSRQGAVKAATWQRLQEGDIVEGRVTGHNKGGLELDINGIKGFMPISQVGFERVEADELSKYQNQRLRGQVMEIRREDRSVIVSRREVLKAEEEQLRQQTFETLTEGQTVHGTVRSIMPYGAFVDIGGIDGLLHVADMSYARVADPHDVVREGQQITVKVLKIDRDTRRIGLGLKQIAPDPWVDAQAKWLPETMVSGRVTRLADFGAFVELEPGVEGLVPIGEMSFGRRIGHPREVVSENEVVKVRVMNVDPERKRISLSIKRVGDDPWTGASVRWPADAIVEGTVTRTTEFGAFVELVAGVEGLIHISELSDTRVRQVGDVVRVGQSVRAKVLEVDEERRRISLSIKQVETMPDYTGEPGPAPEVASAPRKRKKPLKGGLEW